MRVYVHVGFLFARHAADGTDQSAEREAQMPAEETPCTTAAARRRLLRGPQPRRTRSDAHSAGAGGAAARGAWRSARLRDRLARHAMAPAARGPGAPAPRASHGPYDGSGGGARGEDLATVRDLFLRISNFFTAQGLPRAPVGRSPGLPCGHAPGSPGVMADARWPKRPMRASLSCRRADSCAVRWPVAVPAAARRRDPTHPVGHHTTAPGTAPGRTRGLGTWPPASRRADRATTRSGHTSHLHGTRPGTTSTGNVGRPQATPST